MSRSINIALVTNALNIGGMESFLFGLASRLRSKGHCVTFVVTQSVGAWHNRPAEDGFVLLSILPVKWETRRGHAGRVANGLNNFDAVILNHSLTGQSALGRLADSAVAISVLHNNVDPIYRLGLANIDNLDMAVAVSTAVCDEAIRRGTPLEKIMCIRNGVEVFPSYPKGTAGADGAAALKVIFIGRIDHGQKGVFYLPGIISRAVDAGASISVDVVGAGPDLDLLRQQMSDLERRQVVTVHGALPHHEAMALLQSADVLLMPSHFEGQPIILFEAMARGVVPVVSLLPGITDAVVDKNENGILVPVGDEAAFADALARLAGTRSRVSELSRSAWRTALDNFSNDTMTDRYLELVETSRLRRQEGKLPPRSGGMDYNILGRFSRFPAVIYDLLEMIKRLIPSSTWYRREISK